MYFRSVFILFFVFVLSKDFAFAQLIPSKTDSSHLYENIQIYSKRTRFTKFLYPLIFKSVESNHQKKTVKKKVYKKLIQKPYSFFEGKTIRHINIVTLDPFGYSIGDTIEAKGTFLSKTGNNLHKKTLNITIRNLLLIRQNQKFDSLLVKESERLVRSRSYINDVAFLVKATDKNSDSVDIYIRELDTWSIIPDGSVSTSHLNISLTDKNFAGLGHESQNGFTMYTTGDFACNFNYYIPNIRNTYINSTLHYSRDASKDFIKSFAVDRPFFSPFAKWAAGVNFTQKFRKNYFETGDSFLIQQKFKFNSQDLWAGKATQLFKGNTETDRTTNLISAVRFLRIRYLENPIEMYDLQHEFSNENFYLSSIGVSTRKYVQDKYIFKFGVTEDVPIGKVYSVTMGYQEKYNIERIYSGARFSVGNYYTWGYLSANCEYGTFFRAKQTQQGVFSISAIYFTGLIERGKWKFRQFIKPQIIIGKNRFTHDSLTLNDGYGLDGFNSFGLSGTKRLLFMLQTQSYAPWNFIGFRFGPYLIFSFGMLGDEVTRFRNSKIYSQIGFGVLIKNENLVINTFQISIAFYPLIPGNGNNIFKINSFKTSDFGFRDFEIGKPADVQFE